MLPNQVYQIKKMKEGKEVCVDDKHRFAYRSFSVSANVYKEFTSSAEYNDVKANYCTIIGEDKELLQVKIIHGPNKDSELKIHASMLTKPNLFPAMQKDVGKWLNAVSMVESGNMPASIENIMNNVLGDREKLVVAETNNQDPRMVALALKVVAEALEPYLGPCGLAMSIKLITERVFNEEKAS